MTSQPSLTAPIQIACAIACLISCSCSDLKPSSSNPTSKEFAKQDFKPFSERLNEKNGFTSDSNGNWKAINNKRSPYDTKGQSAYFTNSVNKKEYQTSEVNKKSWWGNKNYQTQAYADSKKSYADNHLSPLTNQKAHETQLSSDYHKSYNTSQYATKSANESSHSNYKSFQNPTAQNAQKKETEPTYIDWKEQRSLSIKQSRQLLGRE